MTTRTITRVGAACSGGGTMMAASSRGAIIVEFALAFPMLLVTFVFVCQVLNVFTYDILGSYAAYAAARSYAVHRNVGWDEDEFDLDAAREAAARKAYAIAVAVMATYSMPSGRDERLPRNWDVGNLGLDEFIESTEELWVSIPDASYYAAHQRLGQNFRVIEYSDEPPLQITMTGGDDVQFTSEASQERQETFTIPMKEGYGYPESRQAEDDDAPWYQWFVDHVVNPIGEFFGFKDRECVGFPIKVAQVTFSYVYPTVLTQVGNRYLAPRFAEQRPFTISVYQSCATPIEPIPSAFADVLDDVKIGRTQEEIDQIEERIRQKEQAVDAALDNLHACIETILRILHDERPIREVWSEPAHPPWDAAAGRAHELSLVRVNPEDHHALELSSIDHLIKQYDPDPRPDDENAPDERKIADHIRETWGNPHLAGEWLLDPRGSLLADSTYRRTLRQWIREEVNHLQAEINRLSNERNRYRNSIRENERIIDEERDRDAPDHARIQTLRTQNERWSERMDELDEEIEAIRVDQRVWQDRRGEEQRLIDANDALIRGCLRERLAAVEDRLKDYYEVVGETMEEESRSLGNMQDIMR